MTITYCTQVYFLDNAIEYVRLLASQGHSVHVLIELSPNQLKANILEIETDLNKYPALTSFKDVVGDWGLQFLNTYFQECTSVNFVVYPNKKISSTRKVSKKLEDYITTINPDYIHLDDFSSRTLFQLFFLFKNRRKLIANIHDPLTHSGEFNIGREIYRKLWFHLIPSFVVFSEFSKSILYPQLRKSKKITVLKLMPYTVYKSFLSESSDVSRKYISFVGRISPYKGVDLFVGALEKVVENNSKAQFYIGGKTTANYYPDFLKLKLKNLTIENKFLSNSEMSAVINKSQLIVCPYKDATQSGVIMTAYALGCPVLVTDTGGLPEYVIHGKTGLITIENSVEGITEGIVNFLNKNRNNLFSDNIKNRSNINKFFNENIKAIKLLYI